MFQEASALRVNVATVHVDHYKDGHAEPGGIAETLQKNGVGGILAIHEQYLPVPLDLESHLWVLQNYALQCSAILTPIGSNLK